MTWLAFVLAALAQQPTQVMASLTVKVADREVAAQTVIDDVEARGGWFSSLSEEAVTVRVPVDQTRELLDKAAALGQPVDRTYESVDLTAELTDLRSRLKAREEMLGQYMAVLGTASPKAVVTVEAEVTRVVSEIEQLKGRLKYLEDRSTYAQATISFQFRDRAAPVRDGSSSFPWLNTMNVADLQSAFRYGWRASRSAATPVAPAGFAPYRKRGRFQALSPDDVVFRVRSARNKPRAELYFWREALRTRMLEAGYVLVSEGDVAASGTPGALLELGAAAGESDRSYLVALFVRGRRLVIVEASGVSERFDQHRAAILEAIGQMAL